MSKMLLTISEKDAENVVLGFYSSIYSSHELDEGEKYVILEKKTYFEGRILAFQIGTKTIDGDIGYGLGIGSILIDRLTLGLQVIGSGIKNEWWCAVKMASTGCITCFSLLGWFRFYLWNRKFIKALNS